MNTTGDDASIDTSGVGGEIVGGGGGLVAVRELLYGTVMSSAKKNYDVIFSFFLKRVEYR